MGQIRESSAVPAEVRILKAVEHPVLPRHATLPPFSSGELAHVLFSPEKQRDS